jgi:hypothetical protein
MADPGDRLRYALTDEQHERIFQQEVLPSELSASTRVANPTAVGFGVQPGAGKTALLTAAELELRAKRPTVTLNGDLLRPFHPQYRALQEAVPLDDGAGGEQARAGSRLDRRRGLVRRRVAEC